MYVVVSFCSQVRTPQHANAAASSVGDAEYAAAIAGQLDVNAAVKAILRGAASSPAHDHFLAAYEAGLRVRRLSLGQSVPNVMLVPRLRHAGHAGRQHFRP